MRITNNIITRNTKTNINANKVLVDKRNTQMTTQKKISKASENPVIAIRSLRYSTTLSKISQFADNNIPDAQSWLDVTETALTNMKDILTDVRTLCVNGSTDTLTADDRSTILNQLTQLKEQVYEEGNADYGGRSVFTGYHTTSRITFDKDTTDTTYEISQRFSYEDFDEHRYYCGDIEVPLDVPKDKITDADFDVQDTEVTSVHRMRLAYGDLELGADQLKVPSRDGAGEIIKDADGNVVYETLAEAYRADVKVYDSEEDWKATWQAGVEDKIKDDEVVIIKDSGEVLFGKDIYKGMMSNKDSLQVDYTKTGFERGDLRPEYFYQCTDVTDPANTIAYNQHLDGVATERLTDQGVEIQTIDYTISAGTTLTINTQACEVFNSDIGRDMEELIDVVQNAVEAHEKVDKIKQMMDEAQYQDLEGADTHYQENLQKYLDAAQKAADYADDNLQKTYEHYISNFNGYLESANIAISNVGSKIDRLQMTQTRVENQKTTMEELKSKNEDRDLSDIVIDYYAAYNAYTASLTAAGKIGEQTLLNYL